MDSQRVVTGEIYHIYSKSIAEYKIFNDDFEYSRMREVIKYYKTERPFVSFSRFKERNMQIEQLEADVDVKGLIQIICYCIMPTHIHLVLKQLKDKGISVFMSNALNSYSRYFNIKHNRKGPLWESSFKKVLVESDAQLLHLTRYIHLNPVTAYIVNNPKNWKWSSYEEYISGNKDGICRYEDVLDIKPEIYKEFAEDRIFYQRELARIKNIMLE
jgi:putative transposase